ncbi:MAG: hypothetical protein H0W76_07915 [Pyrinomonadaceae bacterium]|nr:hypothetical protein [Pyrinomonadaceae bacterium]
MSQDVNTASNNLPVLRVSQAMQLRDNDQWENRFEIHSETSNRVYIIAQHKKKRHWGCSCPSYRTRRRCKHLEDIGLPTNETPYEALIRS